MPGNVLGANELVLGELTRLFQSMERQKGANFLTYVGAIAYGADSDIRDAIEAIPKNRKKDKLFVILETEGGFAETAKRIADTCRHHFQTVDFIVLDSAMSAGTILVMSGDAIHMDYYSVLGPIDPQIDGPDGSLVPGLGILSRYEDLIDKAASGALSEAELNVLLDFDQGQLYVIEQARDLSTTLLKEWLAKYKFKDWLVTETRGIPVTDAMKVERAKEVAGLLNDVERWNSHGIGINMEQLKSILNLKIDNLEDDGPLYVALRKYHALLTDYMRKMRKGRFVQTNSFCFAPTMS